MTKDEDFKLLKIQTCILRVNVHCDGCEKKVKKLLQRIEGVYEVKIESEQQKVTVLGSVDCETLVKKLVKAGKRSKVWSQKTSSIKDDNSKAKKPVSEPLKSKQEEEMQQQLLMMLNHQSEPNIAHNKAAKKQHNANVNMNMNMNMHGDGRTPNDISSVMNLAGFLGSSNAGFQLLPTNDFLQGMGGGITIIPCLCKTGRCSLTCCIIGVCLPLQAPLIPMVILYLQRCR